jgi:hypothetical protein
MMLGSYVVASADPHTPLLNVTVAHRLQQAAGDASGGLLAGGAASCRATIVGIRLRGGGSR